MISKTKAIRILLLLELALSAYLVYLNASQAGFCVIGSSCDEVWNSKYADVLGIPMTTFGLIAFSILLLLSFLRTKNIWFDRIFIMFSGFGALFALYLLSVQAFVLKRFCSTCLIIDALMIAIALLASEDVKKIGND